MTAEAEPIQARDPDWAKESKAYLLEHRQCVSCRQRSEVVHHVIPVGVSKALEMEKSNWAAMCHRCHFVVGHACNWREWVKEFWQVVKLIAETTQPITRGAAMPHPTSLTEAILLIESQQKAIQDQQVEIAVLKTQAEQSVGGFLRSSITEKVLLAVVAAAVSIFGGATFLKSRDNSAKIDDVSNRVEQVGSGVDDVKREIVRKKGPFGEQP